ncbi:MAG: hypothetical protein WAW41_11500 [Methylobacter sp.]
MHRKVLPFLLIAIPSTAMADHLSGGFGLMSSAPFWTESAQTLNAGQIAAGVRAEYQQLRPYDDAKLIALREADLAANPELYSHASGEDGHAQQADLHSVNDLLGGSFRLAYGITDNVTVGLRLPFVYRDGIREAGGAHVHNDGDVVMPTQIYNHGSSEGIGDMSFWGQYQFFKDSKQSAALLLGMKAPTGETTNEGFKRNYHYQTGVDTNPAVPAGHSARLETHMQPGSGSWDGMFGLAYGYDLGVVQLNTSAMYTLATRGSQDTDLGDGFNYNFAASLPVHYLTPCAACSWNLVLETNGEWRDHEKRGNITIANSGGNTLYISPGIRFISGQNWNVGTSVGYAVIHDLHGNQSDPDYRIMGAFNMAI